MLLQGHGGGAASGSGSAQVEGVVAGLKAFSISRPGAGGGDLFAKQATGAAAASGGEGGLSAMLKRGGSGGVRRISSAVAHAHRPRR